MRPRILAPVLLAATGCMPTSPTDPACPPVLQQDWTGSGQVRGPLGGTRLDLRWRSAHGTLDVQLARPAVTTSVDARGVRAVHRGVSYEASWSEVQAATLPGWAGGTGGWRPPGRVCSGWQPRGEGTWTYEHAADGASLRVDVRDSGEEVELWVTHARRCLDDESLWLLARARRSSREVAWPYPSGHARPIGDLLERLVPRGRRGDLRPCGQARPLPESPPAGRAPE
ncbi:MAG: hypothetical protein AAF211_19920 [Myxococcota bacterium]